MMDSTDLVPILVGGGVATLAGVIGKFLLDRQKAKSDHVIVESKQKHDQSLANANQENEWHAQEFTRLEKRIVNLEEANRSCMDENAALSKALGMALGRIDGLVITVERLDAANSKRAAEATAQLVAAKAKDVIDGVVANADHAIKTVTEKAVEKVEQTGVVNGHTAIEDNVETVKADVSVIKKDTGEIHNKVVDEVKAGVAEAVKDAKANTR